LKQNTSDKLLNQEQKDGIGIRAKANGPEAPFFFLGQLLVMLLIITPPEFTGAASPATPPAWKWRFL
jgi:hypothetical protein